MSEASPGEVRKARRPRPRTSRGAQPRRLPSYGSNTAAARVEARQPQPLQLRIEAKEAAPPRLLDRLERRKFFEWLLGYCAAAWVVLQALDPLGDIWDWPMALQRAITLALGLGLLPAAVVAWFHGEKGRQRVCLLEVALLCASLLGAALVIGQVCR